MSEKVVVITGTSSGFGLLTSIEMAKRGWRVVATMRNLDRGGQLAAAAAQAGVSSRIDVRRLDVTEFASIPSILEAIIQNHGRIDALVNNAGFPYAGFCEDVSLEELRRQFETNFFGHVAVTQAALPYMRKQGAGHIIMISSIAGLLGQPGISSYSASKFALEGWTEALRLEMNPLGIRVVLIEPGSFATSIWDQGVKLAQMATSENSPNLERSKRFAQYIKSKVVKRDPHEVSNLIAQVAEMPYPKLRYVVGSDAKLFSVLKVLLPWKRYERMVEKELGLAG